MKKCIIMLLFFGLISFLGFSRSVGPRDELIALCSIISDYYKQNNKMPDTINDLKEMKRNYNQDVFPGFSIPESYNRSIIESLEKKYSLSLEVISDSELEIHCIDNLDIYLMTYQINKTQTIKIYKNNDLIFHEDINEQGYSAGDFVL